MAGPNLIGRRSTGLDVVVPPDPVELVFLHPLPFDGSLWDPVRAEFDAHVSYAPTLYSLGETLEEVARGVLDVVEGSRLVVVGNSIGGSCALEVAAVAPDRVEHLVLIGAKAGHRPEPDYRDWALELLATQGARAAWETIWLPLFGRNALPEVIQRARATALSVPTEWLAAGIKLFHGRRDLDPWLREWPGPVTVVSGSRDTAPWPRISEAMARRAMQARFTLVPDCGHYVPLERPDVLLSILAQVVESTR